MFEVSLQLPKSHRKIQNVGNHPNSHTKHFQQAGYKNNTRKYHVSIKFPHGHVRKRSQILMLRSKPLFSWPRRILSFSLRTSLFDSQLLIVYRVFFCLQLDTSLSVSGPFFVITFFVIQVILFFLFFYFLNFFYFHGGRKKGKITTGIWGNGL